jgi:hypothetical protein
MLSERVVWRWAAVALVVAALVVAPAPLAVPVFVVAGQSNAVGFATDASTLDPALVGPFPAVAFTNFDHVHAAPTWDVMRAPTQPLYAATANGFGPELSLGPALAAAMGAVAIVKTAYNSTSLFDDWNPAHPSPSIYGDSTGYVRSALAALPAGSTLSGFFWMQGETDAANLRTEAQYASDLAGFVEHVRGDLAAPNLPFFVGSIGHSGGTTDQINAAQLDVAASVAGVYVIDTSAFGRDAVQDIHFDNAGEVQLGRAFAAAFLSVPEPSMLLAAAAAAGLVVFRRRRIR